MTIAFKPLFQSTDAGIPPVQKGITDLKTDLKTLTGSRNTAGTTTIYTVPSGKVLMITFYSHTFSNGAAGTLSSSLTAGSATLSVLSDNATGLSYCNSYPLFNPIPVFSGETILLYNSGGSSCSASIVGQLLDA